MYVKHAPIVDKATSRSCFAFDAFHSYKLFTCPIERIKIQISNGPRVWTDNILLLGAYESRNRINMSRYIKEVGSVAPVNKVSDIALPHC